MKPSVAIIGLGQVGWRFDEEPGRKAVWTHLGAYKAAREFGAMAAFDSDPVARKAFAARHPDVTVEETLQTLVARACDVVSICTPPMTHRAVLEAALAGSPKAIWCEKPLAVELSDARWMVETCAARQIPLIVSHVRRWNPLWRRFRERLVAGEIGTLRSLRIAMPNRLWSIGSHAVDLLLWLGGRVADVRALELPALAQSAEPASAALFRFESGALGIFQVTGLKEKFVVEAEAIGDRGRLTLSETESAVHLECFEKSRRYEGYEELGAASAGAASSDRDVLASPFVAVANEILSLLTEPGRELTCSGRDAMETQRMLAILANEGRAAAHSEPEKGAAA